MSDTELNKLYAEVSRDRRYPEIGKTDEISLAKLYLENNNKFGQKTDLIPKYSTIRGLRLMSWNIHFFTNTSHEISIHSTCNLINNLFPDIIVLNEAIINMKSKIEFESGDEEGIHILDYLPDYKLLSFCNFTPSWFANQLFGTMILVKQSLIRKAVNLGTQLGLQCFNVSKCHLSQKVVDHSIEDFHMKHEVKHVGFPGIYDFGKYADTESRCFIMVRFDTFDLFAVHLEPDHKSDELRNFQMLEISKYITRPSVIIGDFNFIAYEHYSSEFLKTLQNEKYPVRLTNTNYKYATEILGWKDRSKNLPNYSNWTGVRVDHMFTTGDVAIDGIYTQLWSSSDHIPIIADIKSDLGKNVEHEKENVHIGAYSDITVDKFFDKSGKIDNDPVNNLRDVYTNHAYSWNNYRNTPLFNCQPITCYDFLDTNSEFVKISNKYEFKDPYTFGTFGHIDMMGSYGLYFTYNRNKYNSHMFSKSYTNSLINRGNLPEKYSNTGVQFRVRFTENIFNKDIKVGWKEREAFYDMQNDKKYDMVYAPLVSHLKITPKTYDSKTKTCNLIELVRITLFKDLENTEDIDKKINEFKEILSELGIKDHSKIRLLKKESYSPMLSIIIYNRKR